MPTYAHTVIAGTTGVFEHTIGFGYDRSADVRVYVDRVLRNQGSGATDYLFTTGGTKIIFTTPNEPQTGETLLIVRVTDLSTPTISYTSGSGATQTDLNKALTQMRLALDELQVGAFETQGVSLTPVLAADVPYTHNLGAVPGRVQVLLECTAADAGYAVGDFVEANIGGLALVVVLDATLITVHKANSASLTLPHATSGAATTLDDTKWNYHVRAWR